MGLQQINMFPEVEPDQTIVVWFSCGAASAVAAKMTIEKYGSQCNVRVVNNPVKNEDQDNVRFLRDVEKWLGCEIETAINPKYPNCDIVEVFEDRWFMSGTKGAPCTTELKKKARQHWERQNHHDWMVMGFTADEKDRAEGFKLTERENLIPILVDHGVTKADCFFAIKKAGIDLPKAYLEGLPNANCIGCVKATSPTYWNLIRVKWPAEFAERSEQSRRIGAKLVRVNGERIFLDELPPDAEGRPLKDLDFECGNFCEEWRP